jgi:hypothetical protein
LIVVRALIRILGLSLAIWSTTTQHRCVGEEVAGTNAPASGTNALSSSITIEGVTYQEVRWGRITPAAVTIYHKTGIATFPMEKLPPDVQKQLGSSPEKAAQYRVAEARRQTRLQLATQYARVKTFDDREAANIDRYKGFDRMTMEMLIAGGKTFIDAYESGDTEKAELAYKDANDAYRKVQETKPIFGYKYNELLGDEVTVPVVFNMYTDNSGFYLQVGDGDFSTVAPIEVGKIRDIVAGLKKALEWAAQSYKQRLNARKLIGDWGTVRLEFVSEQGGAYCYTWLQARGPFSKQSLVEETTVELNMLNVRCLAVRMGNARNIVGERIQIERDSEGLK